MKLAAVIFSLMMLGLAAFQIGLAAGQPWGEWAMGGAYPGVYPPPMRLAALIQVGLYALIVLAVLTRGGLIAPHLSAALAVRWSTWAITALLAVSVILNALTPSAKERLLWLPYSLALLGLSLRLSLSPRRG